MSWHYQICKDKDGYFIAEIFKKYGWCRVGEYWETKEELIEAYEMMLKDAKHYKVKRIK